ncbi:hypothetical protein [Streptomyces sp. NPDC058861]|uniref:hypothetical protein n=1 Tax=Streptomyces sp. NPDC058861 TaxID=3346653 RepID=UPI0036A1DB72
MNSTGRMQVFSRDASGAVWTIRQKNPGGAVWEKRRKLGKVEAASDVSVARNPDGRLQVFLRNTGNAVMEAVEKRSGGGEFTAWRKLGAVTAAGDPVAAVNADGRLEVFTDRQARGKDGAALMHSAQIQPGSSGSWNAWRAVPDGRV